MPQITDERSFGGAMEKIGRLGLGPLYAELRQIISGFQLRLLEEKTRKGANGTAEVRELFDAAFTRAGDWKIIKSGGIDWSKCHVVNGTRVCLGVEVQISGWIDVGVLVVPNAWMASFLTDRTPKLADAERHIRHGFELFPLLILAVQHDGPGPALPKRLTRPSVREDTPRISRRRPRPPTSN